MPEKREAPEFCVHCKRQVVFELVVMGEWSHTSGSTYCQTNGGFTATPLTVATPTFHGKEDVL